MNRKTRKLVRALGPSSLSVLEISGTFWKDREPFREYRSLGFSELDICARAPPGEYDLIIAEQVFEHLLYPHRAARNVRAALRPGGHFLVTVPFLYRVHNEPVDCTRWTELGLKHHLRDCGFPLETITTGSRGNRRAVKENLPASVPYRPRLHSLKNEPPWPITVWALARNTD
ncbi:MAG TPA: methyltransferase domain-containing protein [Pyrinomonadaceae bacterium]|nr:methyltransferase domain-containing protein [Pyrinomonadaceae bacterium]